MIAAAFDHRTSRAGDPLLHTHVVVANMTRVDSNQGPVWRAIAGYGLFEHAKAAGHLYQAHLRHLLTARMGVEWGPTTNGYADIVGVPAEVVEAFSKRRTEIAEVLAESGNTSARAAQIATLESRKPKDYQVDPDTCSTSGGPRPNRSGSARRRQLVVCTRPRPTGSRQRESPERSTTWRDRPG